MSRTAAKNTQADIARALRAAKAIGMTIEITPSGIIRVVPYEKLDQQEQPVKVAIPVKSLF